MDDTPTEATPARDRMPSWVPKGIALFWLGFILVDLVEGLLVALRTLLIALLVSLFLSFAIEPAVNALARRGWRRGAATGLVFVIILLVTSVFVFAIGSVVVGPGAQLRRRGTRVRRSHRELDQRHVRRQRRLQRPRRPAQRSRTGPRATSSRDLAGNALKAGLTAVTVVFQIFTIALFTFYLVADGPRLRRTICSVLPPRTPDGRAAGVGARDREDRQLPLLAVHPRGAVDRVPLGRARDPGRAVLARARAVGRHRLAVHPGRRHVPRGRARGARRAAERSGRRRRGADLRGRLPAGRELHLRAARHRADAGAASRGRVRHRDRRRRDPRPGRRAARAARPPR